MKNKENQNSEEIIKSTEKSAETEEERIERQLQFKLKELQETKKRH